MTEQIKTQSLTPQEASQKQNVIIGYVLMLIGCFTGIFWIIGGIWAFVNRTQAQGTLFEGHYKNMTSVFIWAFVWSIVGIITSFFLVGFIVLIIASLWVLIRMVKGLSLANNNQPWY